MTWVSNTASDADNDLLDFFVYVRHHLVELVGRCLSKSFQHRDVVVVVIAKLIACKFEFVARLGLLGKKSCIDLGSQNR